MVHKRAGSGQLTVAVWPGALSIIHLIHVGPACGGGGVSWPSGGTIVLFGAGLALW